MRRGVSDGTSGPQRDVPYRAFRLAVAILVVLGFALGSPTTVAAAPATSHAAPDPLDERLELARRWISARYNEDVGLVVESTAGVAASRYWINDNLLAFLALADGNASERRTAGKIREHLAAYADLLDLETFPDGMVRLGLHEVVGRYPIEVPAPCPRTFILEWRDHSSGAADVRLPKLRYFQLAFTVWDRTYEIPAEQVAGSQRVGPFTLREVQGEDAGTCRVDVKGYADLVLYAALMAHKDHRSDLAGAWLQHAARLWDGHGFVDKSVHVDPSRGPHSYQTYKVALLILADRALGDRSPMHDRALDSLLRTQTGGFLTEYRIIDGETRVLGLADAETTSMAVLALSASPWLEESEESPQSSSWARPLGPALAVAFLVGLLAYGGWLRRGGRRGTDASVPMGSRKGP